MIVWLKRAQVAREEALEYIAKENLQAALRQLEEIDTQQKFLLVHPEAGRPGRLPKTRELVINRTPFILVYRIKQSQIQVLHFLHGAQQWPK